MTNTSSISGVEYAESNGHATEPRTMPLAIVGMACRFGGGVTSPDKLWELVSRGKDVWSEIPETRFNLEAFYHPDPSKVAAIHARGGYFLEEDVGAFDVSFFNMSADAAAAMDPQLRLQLEITFEALESAGIPLSKIACTNTSVFTGSLGQDYKDVAGRDPLQVPRLFTLGTDYSMMANRISHFFDLRGHSTSIDTACSTSLMGLHLACQSLRSGDSDAAVVGGAGLCLSPALFSDISTTGLCGPDGKCYAFDHRAQGYGRGEGVGAVIVKRLSDAVRDGDPIRAIIRETGANQNGRTASITAPDTEAQHRLIEKCYGSAGLHPLETALVEAHGTGTMVGDPREALAIGQTLGRGRPAGKPLYMASVKTNIGHTEAASGLASIIKVAMSMEHGEIAPSLNFDMVNPNIDLDGLGLEIPTRALAWPGQSGVRRASVNNFGFGGTNTHVILEEAGPLSAIYENDSTIGQAEHLDRLLFIVSARDKVAIGHMVVKFREHLQKHSGRYADAKAFQNLAYTLAERRTRFPWTVTVSATDVSELTTSLEEISTRSIQNTGVPPRLGFVFNGQGAQWFGMGRELMSAYPVYAQTLRECDRAIASFGANWSVIEELKRDEESSRVNDVQFSMPLSCAVQLALVELLRDFGIQPAAVTGHSSGEVAAAFAAGVLSIQEAMACTFFRGLTNAEHIATTEGNEAIDGGMMAVGMAPADVVPYLEDTRSGKVVIACINSPSNVTLSGDMAGIQELKTRLEKDNVFVRSLRVQAAFHSHHMLPLQDKYLVTLQKHMDTQTKTTPRAFRENILFVSPVTADAVYDAAKLGPQHWVQNMTQPVLFAQALHRTIVGNTKQQQVDAMIEIGPHSALAGPIRQSLRSVPSLRNLEVAYGSCLERGKDAVHTMQNLAGFLIERGYPVRTSRVNFPRGMDGLQVATGLPSYTWNHNQRFWSESMMSIDHKSREHASHDLLGTRSPGISDKTPIWRHIIRTSELPWVRDHVVQGHIVYPAAGFITMAIEAMREVQKANYSDSPIVGYRLSDMDILKAVVVPESSEGIEVQLFLEPISEKSLDDGKRRFRIYSPSRSGRGWDEVVRGFIVVETDESSLSSLASDVNSTSEYPHIMSPNDVYAALNRMGVSHGPNFQKLVEIHTGQNCSSATFEVGNTADLMPYGFQQPHVIHPIVLDQVFQAAYTTLSTETRNKVGAAVPRFIESLYVSEHKASSSMSVVSRLLLYSHEGFRVTSAVFDLGGRSDIPQRPVIQVDGMRYQTIGDTADRSESDGASSSTTWDICAFVDYEPSFSLNDPSTLITPQQSSTEAEEAAMSQDLERATYHLIADAVGQLSEEEVSSLEWHHRKLYMWMQQQLHRAEANELAPKSSRWAKASSGVIALLLDRVADFGPEGAMLVRVGRQLVDILSRKVAPLELMLEDDLLHRVYSETQHFKSYTKQLAKVVAAFARERPRARILEVGAGTGSGTEPVLQALGHIGFEHYDFTDVSPGFFPRALERFSPWGDKISYTSLNIEDDVARQGFAENSYDLVIAVQALHATKNMDTTMRNVRKLLKDNGRLMMVESTKDRVALNLIFGILPDWWRGEEPERAMSPLMPLPSWSRVLHATGFSDIDMGICNSEENQSRDFSLIVSTAVQQHPSMYNDKVALVYEAGHDDATDTPSMAWLQSLGRRIATITGYEPSIGKFGEVDFGGKMCICITGRPSGVSVGTTIDFTAIKSLLVQSKGVLWVTSGATIECPVPQHAPALGVLRSYRAEDAANRFVSLDLDPERRCWDELSQGIIARVFSATFDMSNIHQSEEVEFAERSGTILLPRVRRDDVENATFANDEGESDMEPFPTCEGRQLRMGVTVPGRLDSIVFRDDEEADKLLPPGWVEVAPCAYGLNSQDVTSTSGRLDETQQLVSECAGVVSRVGSGVDNMQEGDRVVALIQRGAIASRVRMPGTSIIPIPDNMSFSEAASMVLAFTTAYYSVFEVARLERGEAVLVHEATGSVGQACISLAQWKGLDIFATAAPEQHNFLSEQFGIPGDRMFSSSDASFVPGILAATSKRGVDAVINSLTGPLLQKSCGILAMYGRFVEIGKRDIHANMSLEMDMFRKVVSFTAVDLIQLAEHRGHMLQQVLARVIALLGSKTIRPLGPVITHPISKVDSAVRSMQTGKNIGKHILVPEAGDLVKTLRHRLPARLSENATYLIIGGMGGLGRSIARWLVDHGAKNLLLLSRNAVSSPYAQTLRHNLGDAGIDLVLRNCDVADLADLRRVLSECAQIMPPVRGVIHSAAVFSDSILERMTAAQWDISLAPKVAGTWNLHRIFSTADSLDFLIILSSCVGMSGNVSQTNYAAGGAFQDAVARMRAAQRLPCVTIDLGLVTDLGYLADAGMQQLSDKLETTEQYRVIRESELRQLIDYGVRVPLRTVRTSQVLTGLAGSAIRKQNVQWSRELRFSALAADDDRYQKGVIKEEQGGAPLVNLAQSLASAKDADEAAELVEKALIGKVSDMFARPVEDIDPMQPLAKYGVDSLVAVELRNWLVFTTRCDLSIFDLLGAKSLRELASSIGRRCKTTRVV